MEFGNAIAPAINARVHRLARALATLGLEGVIETVPTYRSLLVLFDPLILPRERLVSEVEALLAVPVVEEAPGAGGKTVELPVLYGGEFGPRPRLRRAAQRALHRRGDCDPLLLLLPRIYARIHPRVSLPWRDVFPACDSAPVLPPGEGVLRVRGIAGSQTGVYPLESPGGWRLIGRTPLRLFDLESGRPFLLAPGDVVRFRPVDEEEYWAYLQLEEIRAFEQRER